MTWKFSQLSNQWFCFGGQCFHFVLVFIWTVVTKKFAQLPRNCFSNAKRICQRNVPDRNCQGNVPFRKPGNVLLAQVFQTSTGPSGGSSCCFGLQCVWKWGILDPKWHDLYWFMVTKHLVAAGFMQTLLISTHRTCAETIVVLEVWRDYDVVSQLDKIPSTNKKQVFMISEGLLLICHVCVIPPKTFRSPVSVILDLFKVTLYLYITITPPFRIIFFVLFPSTSSKSKTNTKVAS